MRQRFAYATAMLERGGDRLMKISKDERRSIRRCIEDARYQVEQLRQGTFLREAHVTRLDTIELLLIKIGGKLGKRRHDRGV